MVVDCGGGTADLISYEVVTTTPMVVKECVKGQGMQRPITYFSIPFPRNWLTIHKPGGLCGAVFVDEAFIDMLEQKFGADKWGKMKAESRQNIIHKEWEHMIKQEFDGSEDSWQIMMPFECVSLNALRSGGPYPTISLNSNDVRGVFDPSVDKIRAMVNEQVAGVRAKKGKDPKVRGTLLVFLRCHVRLTR